MAARKRKPKNWFLHILALLIFALVIYQLWIYYQVIRFGQHAPEETGVMAQRLDEMEAAGKKLKIDYRWVPISRISRHLQRAVIVSEDSKFYQHNGFDWEGIQDALEANLEKGEIVRGGSTISQQLAKNLFLSTKRTPWRKGEEVIATVMLEQSLEKKRILELYLNVIEWGDGIFGAEAAARHYFGKPAAKLTPREAAWLAAIVPNPRYYDKKRSTRHIKRKTNIILARMGRKPVVAKAPARSEAVERTPPTAAPDVVPAVLTEPAPDAESSSPAAELSSEPAAP